MTLELLANAAFRMLMVGVVAWLALRLLRVRNPHAEILVWRMLLLASLALPLLLYWRLAPSFATSLQLPVISAGGGAKAADAGATSQLSPGGALWSIYLAGMLALLARLAIGLLGMRRIIREATSIPASDDVRISAGVSSPATFGSVILLPEAARDWPAETREAVLLHERMHVRGRDGHWSWLAQFHVAIFWFSPFAWWLRRRLDSLAETTSDEAVVAANHDPLDYAQLLLEFSRHPNSRSVVMSVAESNVPARIERLLARIPPAATLPRLVRWGAFLVMIPAVVLAASTTRAAAPAEPAKATQTSAQPSLERGFGIIKAADPDEFYPAAAKSEQVTGMVTVRVSLDPRGRLVKADVVNVAPADPRFGFADAALQVARQSEYKNDTGKDASFLFKVKFALAQG